MAEVVLENVTKQFGGTIAVDDVSMTVGDGEFMVLVGPSGCGKSTTLRMIAGLESTSGGAIHIGGREVTRLQPKDRNVAMVFQNYALYAHKNVYDNLGFGLKVRGASKREIDQRVRRAARMLGIDELLQRKPKQLSGGQMQRVALGRALVREPDVFLLDEPLSNLDAKMRVHMREEIGKLHGATGNSMIYVTHDQIEAMTLGDRIAVMKNGTVQQIGKPLEIYDRPANTFVANFIGSPEMNLLDGELQLTDSRAVVLCQGARLALPEQAEYQKPGGGKVIIGLRPEHLSLASDLGDSENSGLESGTLPVKVVLTEQMGAQTLLACHTENNTSLSVLMSRNDRLRPGDLIRLKAAPEHIHLFDFDPQSGVNLLSFSGNR